MLPRRSPPRAPRALYPRVSRPRISRRASAHPPARFLPWTAWLQLGIRNRNSRTTCPVRTQRRCGASHLGAIRAASILAPVLLLVSKCGCVRYSQKAARIPHPGFLCTRTRQSIQRLPRPILRESRPAFETTCSNSPPFRRPDIHQLEIQHYGHASKRIRSRHKASEILPTPPRRSPRRQNTLRPPALSLPCRQQPEPPRQLLHPRPSQSRTHRTSASFPRAAQSRSTCAARPAAARQSVRSIRCSPKPDLFDPRLPAA